MSAALLDRLPVTTRYVLRAAAESGRDVAPLLVACGQLDEAERWNLYAHLATRASQVREARRRGTTTTNGAPPAGAVRD